MAPLTKPDATNNTRPDVPTECWAWIIKDGDSC